MKECRYCEKYKTLDCPNSFYCMCTGDKPYFVGAIRPLTIREKFARWKFVRLWNKKNKNWKECRHKKRRRADALRKAGFEKRYE